MDLLKNYMNIDIEAFKKWYEEKHTSTFLGFTQKEDWYVSHEMLLYHIVGNLEEFNKDTLAESE